jgi:hypothetical protein
MRALCSLLFVILLCGCEPITRKQYVHNYVNVPTTEIQINAVPKPLDIDGFYPYMVWVNGEPSGLNPGQVKDLAIALGLPIHEKPTHYAIHDGEGWTRPLSLKYSVYIDSTQFANERKTITTRNPKTR